MPHEHSQVSIHIDSTEYKSPNPTTGAALYILGQVKPGFALFKEIHGHGDDSKIPNDGTTEDLKNGDHFYSAKDELNPGQ
jgi:hypothetical protein